MDYKKELRKKSRDRQNFGGHREEKIRINPICQICKEKENLVVHHIDQDKKNNSLNNFVTLCRYCHWGLHQFFKLKKEFLEYEYFIK